MPDDDSDSYADVINMLLAPGPSSPEAMSRAMGYMLRELVTLRNALRQVSDDVSKLKQWRADLAKDAETKLAAKRTFAIGGAIALFSGLLTTLIYTGEWLSQHLGFKP